MLADAVESESFKQKRARQGNHNYGGLVAGKSAAPANIVAIISAKTLNIKIIASELWRLPIRMRFDSILGGRVDLIFVALFMTAKRQ